MLSENMESPLTGGKMALHWEWREMEFRKEKFRVMFPYYKCEDSGEQFTTTESDAIWYAQLHNQYCCKYGIPYPEEIFHIREKYGLSAAKMSLILGFGPNQWRLYEQEEIPSVSNGRMIRSIMNPSVFRDLVCNSRQLLGETECDKILTRLNSIISNADNSMALNYARNRVFAFPRGEENGYGELSLPKLKNTMVFILRNSQNVWFTKMNKLLFYIDFIGYRELGHSITGLAYRAIDYGPVPEKWERIYSEFDEISQQVKCAGEYEGIVLSTSVDADISVFSAQEIEIMTLVCKKLGGLSSAALSERSLSEKGWQQCHTEHKIIPYWHSFEIHVP